MDGNAELQAVGRSIPHSLLLFFFVSAGLFSVLSAAVMDGLMATTQIRASEEAKNKGEIAAATAANASFAAADYLKDW